jgi:hypothetical protein
MPPAGFEDHLRVLPPALLPVAFGPPTFMLKEDSSGNRRHALRLDPTSSLPVAPTRVRCHADVDVVWLDVHGNCRFPNLFGDSSGAPDCVIVATRDLGYCGFNLAHCERKQFCFAVADSLEWERTTDQVHRFPTPSGNRYTADFLSVRRLVWK